jgi:parallel beta-helix repeat protein
MRRVIVLIVIFSAVSVCPATIITVDDDGTADFNKIQDAIDVASYGDTVQVAEGTYTENITLKNGVAVIGAGAENCIIDGNLNGSVVTSNSCDPNTVLDGFTITNGSVTWGFVGHGGMYNDDNSSPTVKNCIFKGNEGGGMVNGDSKPVVINCIFSNNTAFFYGGGMLDANSSPEVINCTFSSNTATIGGGMYNWVNSNPIVRNCIIWANTAGVEGDEIYNFDIPDYPSIPVISYSDIAGCGGSGAGWNSSLGTDGGGNIDADPLFADADANDFHLKSQAGRWDANSQSWVKDANTSPCIDAGDWATPIGLEPFPNGGRINMGAYGGTAEASKSYFGKEPCEAIVAGDINGDCIVDFKDLAIMALHWQEEH